LDEWKTDANGTRYRETIEGGHLVREYEPRINGLTPDQLHTLNEQRKNQKPQPVQPQQPRKVCPFSMGAITYCHGDRCAFFDDAGCGALPRKKRSTRKSTRMTVGLECPMMNRQPCRRDCSFNTSGGCIMITE
jgi:hypothetical protein